MHKYKTKRRTAENNIQELWTILKGITYAQLEDLKKTKQMEHEKCFKY